MRCGDIVRFRWGHRSGRWLVLNTRHRFWKGAVRVRCIVVPRGKTHYWKLDDEGWVCAQMTA